MLDMDRNKEFWIVGGLPSGPDVPTGRIALRSVPKPVNR
jgi:hypothetical protein